MSFTRAAVGALVVSVAGLSLMGCGRESGSAASGDAPASPLRPPAAIALDTGWRIAANPRDVGLGADWSRGLPPGGASVSLPNDFNPDVSRAADRGRVVWYSLRFTGPPAVAGRSWNVRFEEVRRSADVWLNGVRIGGSGGPYAPFTLPATSLRPGASNLLVVRVANRTGPGSFPQDWWNWGGLVRGVSLEPVGRLALEELGVMPELGCGYRCGNLLVRGSVRNVSGTRLRGGIEVRVSPPSGSAFSVRVPVGAVEPGGAVPVSFRVRLPGRPELWSPSNPALYGVQVATVAGPRVEQVNSLHVGMRSVRVRDGILYLNGRRLWLHGAAIHEDVDGRGAALSQGDVDTIVSQLQSVGANITRAHYLLSDSLLDALDAAGIMVWSQPPVDHADALLAHAGGRKRALAMLRATILGERSHPSVVVDSVANELSPTPDTTPGTRSYLRRAIALARRLDPTALVGLDTYCYPGFPAQQVYRRLDVLGIDSYFGWYTGLTGHSVASFAELEPFLRQSHARYPKQALVISEFGAEGLYDGPAAIKGTYEFQNDYLRDTYAVLDRLPFMNGSIYWALRDFAVSPGWTGGAQLPLGYPTDGLNHKGLIAYDGTEKPAFAIAAQLFGQAPAFMRPAAEESGTQVSCSFAVNYRNLAQLRHDATAVAVVQPTGFFRTGRLAGFPSRDAQVRVLVRASGRRLPPTLVVEDAADPRIDGSSGCGPVLAKGNTYLLYLTAVKRRPRGPVTSGRYFVVGGPQGAFAHRGVALPRERARVFVHQRSDVGQALPKRISVAQARGS